MILPVQNPDRWKADDAAAVEQWLNAHPDFVQDYVTRCPTPVVLEYLLGRRGVATSTALGHSNTSPDIAVNSASDMTEPVSTRASSGANTPVRKVSAQEFEKRGQTLGRMVTTIDGVPSFLAAGGSTSDHGSAASTRTSRRRRSDLKSTDSSELMTELILDICNELDVTTLSHKILQNVCLLLDADRCSLFQVKRPFSMKFFNVVISVIVKCFKSTCKTATDRQR